MGRVRVLHVVRPSEGGIRSHLLSLVRESDSRRFEHMVACPPGMAEYFAPAGVNVYSLPLRGEIAPAADMAAVRALFGLLRESRVDIVHAHGSKAGLVGRVAAVMAGVPLVVLTVHNTIFHQHLPGWKVQVFAALERFLAGYTARIIAVSEALREELVRREGIGPDRIVTVYNGIALGPFIAEPDRRYLERVTGIPAGRKVVGTVARLAHQKGLKYLLGAAARLTAAIDNLAFVLVGEGPLRKDLERQAGEMNLAGKLFFTGQRQDVDRLLPCFDVFVLPSLTEGLPLTLLEAMAAGRPVVATRVGGIPEVVLDGVNGLLVNPGDVEGLANAIEDIVCHKARSEGMGQVARELVQRRFTSGKMARDTEEVYCGLLSGEGRQL